MYIGASQSMTKLVMAGEKIAMKKTKVITAGELALSDIDVCLDGAIQLELPPEAIEKVKVCQSIIQKSLEAERTIYGVNTGFGRLANQKIDTDKILELQHNLIRSHAAGTGPLLSDEVVRLIMLMKLNSLAQGYSGVSVDLLEALQALLKYEVYPCIPSKGSVGASGDLAPLAHLAMVLIGEGEVHYRGKRLSSKKGLKKAGLKPLKLGPKEGLALINGTQVSTAIALKALNKIKKTFHAALITGSLSIDAAAASYDPFDARIHEVRLHKEQQECAAFYRDLLEDSQINLSHSDCGRVQDPYSLRCQPQVMGACLAQIRFASQALLNEANAVTDNPLIFSDDAILSGGNFHAEAVAMACDNLALAIAEIGALSERRIALLMDDNLSGLPLFLAQDSGLHSGFMIPQVTAASLASENKSLAHPASVDSIPTSANQEDHVSMATFAARRLLEMADNTATIVGIELLAACQGIDLRAPLKTSPKLEAVKQDVRKQIAVHDADRYMAPDIEWAKGWVLSCEALKF